MNKQIALILGFAIAGSNAAIADDHETASSVETATMEIGVDTDMSIDQQFRQLDSDGNGMISEAEAEANADASHSFQSFDNGDGKLSKKEFMAGLKAQASGKGNVNAGASAEDGSLEGENATIGAGTDTEIDVNADATGQAEDMASDELAAGIGAKGSASDGEEAANMLSTDMQARFRGLDNNDDGVITKSEAKADPIIIGVFDMHDKNDNGKLNESEFVAAAKAGAKTDMSGES